MHARYYGPEVGMFIMKDPIEGFLSNPITHGFRIKCGMTKRRSANGPVNKIDPGGTVNLGALDNSFKPHPPTKHGPPNVPPPPPKPPNCYNTCGSNMMVITPNGLPGNRCRICINPGFASSLTGEECGETVCQIEGDDLYIYYFTGETSNDPTRASTVLVGSLGDLAAITDTPSSGIIEQPNKDYDIKYEVDEYGNVTLTGVDKDGNLIKLSPEDQDILDSLEKGINDAIRWLGDQGFTFNDVAKSKKEIMNFINKYAEAFYKIAGGVNPKNAYELAYKATVGMAIASQIKLKNDRYYRGNHDTGQYDQEIGFWTSFWARRTGINIPFESNLIFDKNGKLDENKSTFGLVDLANISKAISFQEKFLDPNNRAGGEHRGMMMVAYGQKDEFETSPYYCPWGQGFNFTHTGEGFFDPFNNIGLGTGHLFGKLTRYSAYEYSKGVRSTPTIANWRSSLNEYGGGSFYSIIILDELVYKGKARKRQYKGKNDTVHNQPLLP